MEKIVFTREELYELVWSEPLSRLARKYNISDNGIKKRCKKMEIPLPKSGYWSRIKHGYKVPIPKLSTKYKDEKETILCYRDKDGNYVEKITEVKPVTKLKYEIVNDPSLPLTVPDQISRFDSLVAQAKKSLSSRGANTFRNIGMLETRRGEIDIAVSKANVDRALRFMNSLIKLLRSRKHDLIVDNVGTYAVVFGEKVPVRIKEKSKIVYVDNDYGRKERQLHPNGLLAFVHNKGAYNSKEWLDGQELIESRLADILAHLETFAQKEIEDRVEWEKQKKIKEEEERRLKELRKRKDEEVKKIKKLINHANYWKQAQILREYVQAFEKSPNFEESQLEWINWAKQKIEWFDPFTQAADELLNNHDRDKLIEELNEPKNDSRNPFSVW